MARKISLVCFYILPAIFFILFFCIFVSIDEFRIRILYDSDINWLLTTGELIVKNHFQLPHVDIFSYTHSGHKWVLYQWLFEVITYLAYLAGNYYGIGVLGTLIFTLTFTIIFILLRKLNVHILYCIVSIVPGSWAASATWYARPASITYLFVSLLLLLFYLAENKNHRLIWFMPPIFLLWANMHLGFTFGICLLLVFLLYKYCESKLVKTYTNTKFIKSLTFSTLVSIICTLITPYNVHLYGYMLTLMNSDYMNESIKELLSPDFHKSLYKPVLIMIGFIIPLSFFQKKQTLFYLICLGVTTCMTLHFVRNLPFFAIFATIILAIQLQNLQEYVIQNDNLHKIVKFPFVQLKHFQEYETNILSSETKLSKIPLSTIIIILFILLLIPVQNNPLFRKNFQYSLNYTKNRPVAAYKHVLEYNFPGRFYTYPTWGSYAIHKLYPEYKVFIDTRFDMYGDDFFKEAHKIKQLKDNWLEKLEEHDVNWIAVPNNSSMAKELRTTKKEDWFIAYKDELATIFVKNSPGNRRWFRRSGAKSSFIDSNSK